jgi:four helix bundle protein
VKTSSYRDLIVWQKAMDLACVCYSASRHFPVTDRYGLTTQIRRAAASIPANIAEGYERSHRGEYLHFLSIARGSLGELETHLLLSERLGLVNEDDLRDALALCDEVGRMLRRMQQRMKTA